MELYQGTVRLDRRGESTCFSRRSPARQSSSEAEAILRADGVDEFLFQRFALLIAQAGEQLGARTGEAADDFRAAEATVVDLVRPQGRGGLLDALDFTAGKRDGETTVRYCSE